MAVIISSPKLGRFRSNFRDDISPSRSFSNGSYFIDTIFGSTYNHSTKKRTKIYTKGVLIMLAVKSMDLRDNFKSLCDKVFNGEILVVSRPKNENIVMISEKEYNDMLKAKRNAEYLDMLDKSMNEANAGGFITKSISELNIT